jgi:hypothetical protein
MMAADDPAPAETAADGKAELLERIEKLQEEIPDELRTKLAIIAMKLATGYCSPWRVDAFEKALATVDADRREKFAEEWQLVKQHPLWPSLDDLPQAEDPQ